MIGETKRQENGSKSEYRLLNNEVQLTDVMIRKLTNVINCQIENDMVLEVNKKIYFVN